MVLYGRYPEPGSFQDLIRRFNLRKIMVGYTHDFYLAALQQRNELLRIFRRTKGIVNLVNVKILHVHALQTRFAHIYHAIPVHTCHLRCKLGRKDNLFTSYIVDQSAENLL